MFDDAMESLWEFLWQGLEGIATGLWSLLTGAFEAGDMDESWWASVVGGTITYDQSGTTTVVEHPGMLNVVVLATIPMLLIYFAIQCIISMFRSSTAGLIRGFGVAVFSIPTVYIMTGLVWTVVQGVDQLTRGILNIGMEGDEGSQGVAGVASMFGVVYDPESDSVALDENFVQWEQAANQGEPGHIILPLIILAVTFLCVMFLSLMMTFRTVAVIVLTVFGPIAIYSLTLEPAKAAFSKWVSVLLGLILAKPAAAVIVKVGMTMSQTADDWTQMVAGICLVLVAALAPVATLMFISFFTGGGSEPLERAALAGGGRVGRGSTRALSGSARQASRVGRTLSRGMRR
jgi:hypothetical protein